MADNTVTIHINAKTDDAKRGIDQVNTSIGRMGPESQNAAHHVGGLGETLKGVGKIAAGFIAASAIQAAFSGITSFAGGTVKAAVGLGESLNAVNVIFRGSAKQVLDWGENNAIQFGLSQRAFNQLATPLGAILKNTGMSLTDVAQNTIDLTKRAADMASVFNTEVSDALAAINSGLRGEANPLERYGVGLKAATVEARALADASKTSAKDLTEEELAVARLNLIFEQTVDTHGDFIKTSGDLANATRIAAAEMEKLQAQVGAKLLPAMLALEKIKLAVAGAIVDKLLPAMDQIGNALIRMKDHVVAGAKPFLDLLLPAIQKVIDFIKNDVAGIGSQFTFTEIITGKIIPAFDDLKVILEKVMEFLKPIADYELAHFKDQVEAVRGAFDIAAGAIKEVTGFLRDHTDIVYILVAAYIAYQAVMVGGAIYKAVAAGIAIVTAAMTTGLIPALISIAAKEGILTAAQVGLNIAMAANPIGVIAVAIAALVAVGVLLYLNFDKITEVAGYLWDRLKEVGTGIYNAVVGAFRSIIDFVKSYWPEIISLILLPFFPIVALATDAFGIRTALVDAFKSLGSMILDALGNVGSLLYGAGRSIVMGLWKGIMSMWDSVVNSVKRLKDAAVSAAKGVFGYGDATPPTPGGSDVPEMATGGVVMARPGGTLVRLGEAGKAEAVIPLDQPRGSGGPRPAPKPGLGKVDAALAEQVAALQAQITEAYLSGGMKQVDVVRARQSEMMGVVDTASAKMANDLGITLPDATKIMFATMLKQSAETQSALDKVGQEYMAAQIEAYLSGGMKQVAIVRQSQRSQQEMMDSVHDAASKMAVDLGITLPDATKIMFDRIIKQETALATMQEQLAKDNMHAQIDAYLKGGQASVDIVKKQQADTSIQVDMMAKDISKTFGIEMPEAIVLATKAVGNITAAMLELGKQSVSMTVELWKLGGNNAQKGAMVGVGAALAALEEAQRAGTPTGDLQATLDAALAKHNALAGSKDMTPYLRQRDMTIPRSQGGGGPETHDILGRLLQPEAEGMASGGVVKATPGGIIARLGEGGRNEAVIPLGRGAGALGSTTINNYSITLSGVITDPVATGQAVADALNRASLITGPLVLSGAVRA